MDYLPGEILVEIFTHLKPSKNIFLVCKRFENVMKTNMLWGFYINRDFLCSINEMEKNKTSFITLYRYRFEFENLKKWFAKIRTDFMLIDPLSVKNFLCNNTKIFKIPREIYLFSNLETISFYNSSISEIPKELFEITSLESINFSCNNLTEIPPEISNLKNLQYLSLSKNKISKIPKELFQLEKLTIINLNNNLIKEIPKEIENLKNLEYLNMFNNEISKLPVEICRLAYLKKIYLSGNPICYSGKDEDIKFLHTLTLLNIGIV